MCQLYDKEVDRSDKYHHHNFLNGIRVHINMCDKYQLVLITNQVYISELHCSSVIGLDFILIENVNLK